MDISRMEVPAQPDLAKSFSAALSTAFHVCCGARTRFSCIVMRDPLRYCLIDQ